MIVVRFVTSSMKESTLRRAISQLCRMEIKKTDKIYLATGASASGSEAKMLSKQGIIKKSNYNRKIWIVEKNKETAFFEWIDRYERITLSEVYTKTKETDKALKLEKGKQKQEQASALAQQQTPLATRSASNFDRYPYTKFEKARIIEARALQIAKNSQIFVDPNGTVDPIEIAEMELDQGVCPITVRRTTNPALDAEIRKKEEIMKIFESKDKNEEEVKHKGL